MLDVTVYGKLSDIVAKQECLINGITSGIVDMEISEIPKESISIFFRDMWVENTKLNKEVMVFVELHHKKPKLMQEIQDQLATKIGSVCNSLLEADLTEAYILPVNPLGGFWSSRPQI